MIDQPPPAVEVVVATAPPAPDGRTVYPAQTFAAAQPFSALDMVQRLPGFVLEDVDTDVRGFGGGGNLLVDGDWPPGKQESLSDLLKRIPATSVERIELIRAGTPGVDTRGKALVANVVRRRVAETSGSVEAEIAGYRHARTTTGVRVQAERRQGDRLINGSFSAERLMEADGGVGHRRRFGSDGRVLRDAILSEEQGGRAYQLKGGYADRFVGGRLTLNGGLDVRRGLTSIVEAPRGGIAPPVVQREREDTDDVELGSTWDGRLAGSNIAVVGLLRRGRAQGDERAVEGDETEAFSSKSRSGESVLRVTAQRDVSSSLQVSTSAEMAYNVLDGSVRLTENGVDVPLPGADIKVEETRGEVMASAAWRPTAQVVIEAGAKAEHSVLRQSGDAQLRRPLSFLKPRVAASWTSSRYGQVRLRVEREVGQLDFGDFTSSAALDQGGVTAGNRDLRPDSRWIWEAEWERRLGSAGALVLTYRHEAVSDVVDRLVVAGPSGELFDARGNIGDARRDIAKAALTLSLDGLGVPGGLFKGEVARVTSSVRDPTTGLDRRLSQEEPIEGELHFTQDLPARRLRWGVDAYPPAREYEFRFDEVRRDDQGWRVDAFAEHSLDARWRLRLDVHNLVNRPTARIRDLYDPSRGDLAVALSEDRSVKIGRFVRVTARRTF